MTVLTFSGLPGRSGELTWGQRWIWDIMGELAPHESRINNRAVVPLPAGTTLSEVLTGLGVLVRDHESLRTRYFEEPDGELRQVVESSGEIPVEIDSDSPQELQARLLTRPFRLGHDFPLRPGVVVAQGVATHLVLVIWHLSTDGWSTTRLKRLAVQAVLGEEQEPAPQPLDHDQSARGERALRYWRAQLEKAPRTMFPDPPVTPREPRFWNAVLRSPALARDTRALAERLQSTVAGVLLAATALLLGARSQQDAAAVRLVVGNRADPEIRRMVGCVVQDGVAVLDLSENSFAALVKRAWLTSMSAYKNGQYDPRLVRELIDDIGVDLSCAFNFHDWDEPVSDVTPEGPSEFNWSEKLEWNNVKFYLHVVAESDAVSLELHTDTAHLPPDQTELFLRGVERLVAAAATGEDDTAALLSRS